ncbi:MAG: hypothetical protein JOY53_19295 [Acidobacteriaceae bacterium]|nr:hypothetical protein [Acidobacteriaceae bacterium]
MLRTRADAAADQDTARMLVAFKTELDEARAWIGTQPNMETLFVPYAEIIASPEKWAAELSKFLDGLDVDAMAASVNPQLRHYGGSDS